MLQEILIIREDDIVQGMVVTKKYAGVILGLFEGHRITKECHLMTAGSVCATSHGRQSSAGRPLHTARGFRSA